MLANQETLGFREITSFFVFFRRAEKGMVLAPHDCSSPSTLVTRYLCERSSTYPYYFVRSCDSKERLLENMRVKKISSCVEERVGDFSAGNSAAVHKNTSTVSVIMNKQKRWRREVVPLKEEG